MAEQDHAAGIGDAQDVHTQAIGDDARLALLVRSVLAPTPTTAELVALRELLGRQRERLRHGDSAEQLLSAGASPTTVGIDRRELAAWTLVAHTLLNLDEAVTLR